MDELSRLERDIIEKLVAGDHPVLAALRSQAAVAKVAKRVWTGVGFHTYLWLPEDMTPAPVSSLELGDVHATAQALLLGAGFVMFIREGRIRHLEGFSYGEPWPDTLEDVSLQYVPAGERDLSSLLGRVKR